MTAPVLAIVGPTAAGKSALAMDVARIRAAAGAPTEIVAVDAFTVYRGMDVGTAKPTAADRREVPHHCVDLLEPDREVTVVWFRDRAREAVADIRDRGATPLLVGGSGLYFRAVVDDLRFPPTDEDVRARIRDRWFDDPAAGHAALAERDPDAAARIDPQNLRRTVRALEVIELTGEAFSAYDDSWDDHSSVYDDLRVAYLEPPGDVLKQRIRERTEAMVAGTGPRGSLLAEARRLRGRPLSRTARQGIGYREAFAVLDGELDRDELVERIRSRTWRYARRQRSWFRKDPRCDPEPPARVRQRWTPAGATTVPGEG